MHFSLIVHIENKNSIKEQIDDILSEHKEQWDWYQIGGRWSGNLGKSDPKDNPENWETCPICNGTGLRNDKLGKEARKKDPAYTCNGCSKFNGEKRAYQDPEHPGQRLKWPTEWKAAEDDIVHVSEVNPKADWYAMIIEYDWITKEFWNPNTKKFEPINEYAEKTVKEILDDFKIKDGYLVQVDIHN